ncbi:hypothetical protein [Streptomyces sp. S.PB5]|uniref:hypothetical protein n=1 Tax=Streptomyces sp. S.PB5 TaxID=3020844 RepID=UPI0025B09EC2|nr:hypothetical protein [Streptomyces sp. S.PB5]MDN3029741.1 hypothetical protein [Streptomyces sp. S.PB5]
MFVRTPLWLNLIALAAAVVPFVVLGLPWYAGALGFLLTGIVADRAWAAYRRGHDA